MCDTLHGRDIFALSGGQLLTCVGVLSASTSVRLGVPSFITARKLNRSAADSHAIFSSLAVGVAVIEEIAFCSAARSTPNAAPRRMGVTTSRVKQGPIAEERFT